MESHLDLGETVMFSSCISHQLPNDYNVEIFKKKGAIGIINKLENLQEC